MEFGYPGSNTTLETHGVSEESFWPSFTDIMMVIVMVFLLVTVAVILNNWSLISDLKNSIKAQQVASTLAEDRKEVNIGLESELTTLKKKILSLNDKYKIQQTNLLASQEKLKINQDKLVQSQQAITERDKTLSSLHTKLETINQELAIKESSLTKTKAQLSTSQTQLGQKETALTNLQADFENTVKEKNALATSNENKKKTISENKKAQLALKLELSEKESALLKLQKSLAEAKKNQLALVSENKDIQEKQAISKATIASLQKQQTTKEDEIRQLALTTELENLRKTQTVDKETLQQAKDSTRLMQDSLEMAKESLKELELEKQRIIVSMSQKVSISEKKSIDLEASIDEIKKQLASKIAEIKALKDSGHSQLLSLQGDYDILDAKYKKLLRPARSSKGKFVVAVSYKKKSGKRIIRIKSNPKGSYKTVKKSELHKILVELKNKHKADLYIKVIIPESSGLTYNEAWKFTSNLQKKYDYYHQPDKK